MLIIFLFFFAIYNYFSMILNRVYYADITYHVLE